MTKPGVLSKTEVEEVQREAHVQSNKGISIRNLFLVNRLVCAIGAGIEYGRWQYTYEKYRKKYEIDPAFVFYGPGIMLYDEGRIILGENSYIGRYSSIQSSPNCEVRVGKKCGMCHHVMIVTASPIADQDFGESRKNHNGNVRIEDNCWIGARVFINPDVSIGTNSVVGANSVVTRDIPPHSIAAGTPAKVVKFKSYINERVKVELAKTYWNSLSLELKSIFRARKHFAT